MVKGCSVWSAEENEPFVCFVAVGHIFVELRHMDWMEVLR